jgi:predicted DNA binding CopG/RHH family protein
MMAKRKVNQEEIELLESYEGEEWKSVKDLSSQSQRYRAYAQATIRKDARVNIRISTKDLDALQTKALEEGLPYQTLIASILHKYISGRLLDRT